MTANSKFPDSAGSTLNSLLQNRPQSLGELTAQITPAIHAELKRAVELRKFSDGSRLSAAQLENCLQLVILYEGQYLPEEQRTGFNLPTSCRSQQNVNSAQAGSGPVQTWTGNPQDQR